MHDRPQQQPQQQPLTPQQAYYAALIPQLAEPYRNFAWQFSGFRKQMELLAAELEPDDPDLDGVQVFRRLLPDAFYVDAKERVVLLEIVETSDITNAKARAISDAFWLLDTAEWQLAVV